MNYNRKEISADCTRYYLDDQIHRTDGPAIECINGTKKWFAYDKLHRIDGPAIEWNTGGKVWYINGKEYSEQKFNDYIHNLKIPEYFSQLRDQLS